MDYVSLTLKIAVLILTTWLLSLFNFDIQIIQSSDRIKIHTI